MSAELDELRKEYRKFQEQMRQRTLQNPVEQAERLREELNALTASVTSASGTVTIVAGPGGAIRDIQLTDRAMQQPAGALAAELKTTVQQAVAAAARQQATLVDEHTGGQLNMYDQVMQTQAEAFGTTVEDLRAAAEEAPQSPPPVRNEDDFSENTVMTKDYRPPPAAPSPPPSAGSSSAADQFLQNLFNEDD